MFKKVSSWWGGKVADRNDYDSNLIFPPLWQKPFIRRAYEALANFWIQHWKWIIGTTIGVIAVAISYFKK
jgi:hypothetical protein